METNFNNTKNKLISSNLLINLWEEYLNIKNKKIPKNIIINVKSLWNLFNTQRKELPKDYMSNNEFITGYIASFFLPNIQRIYAILSKKQISEYLKDKIKNKKTIKICDIGSGPLSAVFGIMFFLGEVINEIPDFEIVTVEKSQEILEFGQKLLSKVIDPSKIKIRNIKNISLVEETFDIVCSANVLNEIPNSIQNSYIKKIYEITENGGVYLSVEPGQDRYSKRLSSVRDNTISKYHNFKIISPCPHNYSCPLSEKSQRKDWCWFQTRWSVPETQKLIDEMCGIEHDTLNYSFVTYVKVEINNANSSRMNNDIFGISVSDPIFITPEKKGYNSALKWMNTNKVSGELQIKYGGKYKKNIICSGDGSLYSIVMLLSDKNNIYRGSIAKNNSNYLLCKERS